MTQLETIKKILSERKNLLTCDKCRFQWIPFGNKYQDTCPSCLKIQGLSEEDSRFLALYDDNDQTIDEL